MAEISGSISTFSPDNNSAVANPPVNAMARATVIVPVAEGGVQDLYSITLRLHVFYYSNCLTDMSSAINFYQEAFVPQTVLTSPTAIAVNQAGFYLAKSWLVAQKRNPDGTFGPEVLLDKKVSSFRIGNPSDCAPFAWLCNGEDSPIQGCSAPSPANGATIPIGTYVLSHLVAIGVSGFQACSKKFHFVAKWTLTGPINPQSFTQSSNITGINNASLTLVQPTTFDRPGAYHMSCLVTAQRSDSPNAVCNQIEEIGSFTWSFTVVE